MWIPFTLPGVYIFFRGRGLFYWRKPQRRTELKAVPHILRVCGCVCVLSFKCCIPSAFSSRLVQSLLLLSHYQTPTIILSSSTSVTLASIKLVPVKLISIRLGLPLSALSLSHLSSSDVLLSHLPLSNLSPSTVSLLFKVGSTLSNLSRSNFSPLNIPSSDLPVSTCLQEIYIYHFRTDLCLTFLAGLPLSELYIQLVSIKLTSIQLTRHLFSVVYLCLSFNDLIQFISVPNPHCPISLPSFLIYRKA